MFRIPAGADLLTTTVERHDEEIRESRQRIRWLEETIDRLERRLDEIEGIDPTDVDSDGG